MVQMVSQTSQYGFWYYGFLTSLICIDLAVINMLPLPGYRWRTYYFCFVFMDHRKKSQRKSRRNDSLCWFGTFNAVDGLCDL